MRFVWRLMTGRCPYCGQPRLAGGHRDSSEVTNEINGRVGRLAEELGRSPQAQNCHKCNRLIFEGEAGFTQRYLLVDIV